MKKLNVCVIFGGRSSEHEVSRISAVSVINNIDKNKYNLHIVGITKVGEWFYFDGDVAKIPDGSWEKNSNCKAVISPDSKDRSLLLFGSEEVERVPVDLVFPVLHGKWGEDGTIQGLLELAGIPYVGSGVVGSSICMDKCVAKILFKEAGIPQADWCTVRRGGKYSLDEIARKLGYPLFVKPSNAGSSVGVSKARNIDELSDAVEQAFDHDSKVLIEEYIDAREIEVSAMGNSSVMVADAFGEVVSANEFYDYQAKYENAGSRLIIPADIDAESAKKIKNYAEKAYEICECRGMARIDFFVKKNTGEIYLNEINTVPGFTSISMYPKMWEASGLSYPDLLDKLIQLGVEVESDG